MSHTSFSQHLLDLIEEDDRLIGLTEAIDIRLEEDPVNNQWVFSVAPRRDIPLPLKPSTKYGVAVEELDNTIRGVWGEVAQLAKDVSAEVLEDMLLELQAAIPSSEAQQPSFDVWLPTEDPDQYESVRTVVQWEVNQLSITPSYAVFQLVRSNRGYSIIDPAGKQHHVKHKTSSTPSIENKEDTPRRFIFNVNDESSIEAALENARATGLNNLSASQRDKLVQVKHQTRIFSFLNGLTIFTGVVAFLFFLMGAHMVVPFLGPIIYIGAVAYAYNRD